MNQRHKRKLVTSISHLPDECITHIFTAISDPRDRSSCAAVSKTWLHLLATMPPPKSHSDDHEQEISRCLDGANDTSLAALLVGAHPSGPLTQLCIRSCSSFSAPPTGITDYGLGVMAQACPRLKVLLLWNCMGIRDKGLSAVARSCTALERLEISNSPSILDDGLTAIARHCKRIATLSLDSCPLVTDRSLMAFAESSPNLTSISLKRCPLVGDMGIVSVICSLPQLSTLKLGYLKMGDSALRAIGERARQLQVLSMEKIWGPSESGYSWIGEARRIDSLSLISCAGLTARSFDGASTGCRFACVKKLTIGNSASSSDEVLLALTASTPFLQSLTLHCCSALTHRGIMQSLANCRSTLKSLSLVNCNISTPTHHHHEAGEDPNEEMYPLLDTMKMRRCTGITDRFLAQMGGACRRVKKVAVTGMGGDALTDKGLLMLLRPLYGTKKLESLDLSGCKGITDRSVAAIARACGGKLQSLRLRGCEGLKGQCLRVIGELCPELRELDLSRCRIGDDGLLRLAQAAPPRLQMLSLAGCGGITDAGLGFVELMCGGGLDMLDVRCCPTLTQRGISSVMDTLFWCDLTA